MSPITSRRLTQSLSCGGGWLLCLTLVAVLGPEVASAYNHRPENDFCEDAIPVPVGGEVWGTLMRATSTVKYPAQMPCDKPEGWDVWYTFVGTGRVVTIDTCGNYFQGPRPYYWDSQIAVYPEGYCGTSAPVNTCKRSLVATDDTKNDRYGENGDGVCSSVEFRSWPGKTYYIRVFGYDNTWDKFDDFQLRIHDGNMFGMEKSSLSYSSFSSLFGSESSYSYSMSAVSSSFYGSDSWMSSYSSSYSWSGRPAGFQWNNMQLPRWMRDENPWGSKPEFMHCTYDPKSPGEILAPGNFVSGLGVLTQRDKYESIVCVKGHECAKSVNSSFCFVADKRKDKFIFWDTAEELEVQSKFDDKCPWTPADPPPPPPPPRLAKGEMPRFMSS